MADLPLSNPDPEAGDEADPRVVGVDSDDADALLSALQSETARDLLSALYDDPATPSDLADELDTSIQNVRYHLDNLTDADLVTVADTVYSEKGREMKVYAPSAKPLVVFAGDDEDAPGLAAALSRLLGALGVLGLASVAVQRVFGGGSVVPGLSFGVGSGGDSMAATTVEDATAGGPNGGPGGTADDGAGTTVAESAEGGGEVTRTATEATRTAPEATRTVTEEAATVTERGATVVEETTTTAIRETTTTAADAAGAASAATNGLPPGLLFFAGGVVVLLALGVAWYRSAR